MKNLIIILSLILAMVVACNTALALVDTTETIALLHCDSQYLGIGPPGNGGWGFTPDDNSSGRIANDAILNKCQCPISWYIMEETRPTLTSGSPYGGSYYSYDGVDDSIYLNPGWRGGTTLSCEFNVRYRSFDESLNGLVSSKSGWAVWLVGGTSPHIAFQVQSLSLIHSPKVLVPNQWYNVQVTVDANNLVTINVDGNIHTQQAASGIPGIVESIVIGGYENTWANYLNGDMDEIRIGTIPGIPEPPPIEFPPYTDNSFNRGLIHCDESVTNQWPNSDPDCFLTPDDNSSGRLAVSPIMNASNDWGIARDDSTMPTFKTNSPYGGDYLAFDGNDSIIVTNAWPGGDNMDIDLNFRFNGLPPLSGDNYMGVFITYPVKTYIQNIDNVRGKILMIVYDMDVNPHFFWSNKVLSPNVWYRLSFSVSNNNVKVIVGNEDDGYATDTTTVPSLLQPAITDIIIGDSYFVPSRFFKGDMDEIRWGIVVPEPFTFGFIGLLGLLAFRK